MGGKGSKDEQRKTRATLENPNRGTTTSDPRADPAKVLHQRLQEREERRGQVTLASLTTGSLAGRAPASSAPASSVTVSVTPSPDEGHPNPGAASNVARMRAGLDQRGNNLTELRGRTLELRHDSESFYSMSHFIANQSKHTNQKVTVNDSHNKGKGANTSSTTGINRAVSPTARPLKQIDEIKDEKKQHRKS